LQWAAPPAAAWACWGVALMSLLWALSQWWLIAGLPFGMPHWGMSFPCAAFSALTLRLAQTPQGSWLHTPALWLLGATSLLIVWLSLNTWRGLMNGTLLVPEK